MLFLIARPLSIALDQIGCVGLLVKITTYMYFQPKSMKSHAIIEKTAKFIGRHGTQMEIILKTKQANNPQFNFLNYSDELNPYYKYLVTAIRTHAYKPQEVVGSQDDSSADGKPQSTQSSRKHSCGFLMISYDSV